MARAGLNPQRVVLAGWELADRVGFGQLSLGELATRLGVRVPSLYKHIGGVDDLRARIAERSCDDLRDTLDTAVRGRQGRAALTAIATSLRQWARRHPGGYQAMIWDGGGASDELGGSALGACLDPLLEKVAIGYGVAGRRRPGLVLAMCSALHGFITLEQSGLARSRTAGDAALEQIIEMLDHALSRRPGHAAKLAGGAAEAVRGADVPGPPPAGSVDGPR